MKNITKLCLGLSAISMVACTTTGPAEVGYGNLTPQAIYGQCEKCDLQGINLAGANIERANLSGANLSSANLEGANLERVDFTGANLTGVNARKANFERANLTNAHLVGANLERANFERALITGANFEGANVKGANFYWAAMTPEMKDFLHHHGAKNLDKAILITNLEHHKKGHHKKGHHKKAHHKTYKGGHKPAFKNKKDKPMLMELQIDVPETIEKTPAAE